jgi:PAS domain S-box-containing protein
MMPMDLINTALLGSLSDGVVASNGQGEIELWNPGAERMFGFSAEEAIGQSLDLIIPENQRDRHWTGYDQVMATGESKYGAGDVLAVPAVHRDGSRLSIEFTIVPIKDAEGQMLGMVSVLRDVTARFNELRELRRRIAAQS